jgi:hypothetical protein
MSNALAFLLRRELRESIFAVEDDKAAVARAPISIESFCEWIAIAQPNSRLSNHFF